MKNGLDKAVHFTLQEQESDMFWMWENTQGRVSRQHRDNSKRFASSREKSIFTHYKAAVQMSY